MLRSLRKCWRLALTNVFLFHYFRPPEKVNTWWKESRLMHHIENLVIGAFDFKRRCTEWSVYDIKVLARAIREQMDPMLSNRSRSTLMSYTQRRSNGAGMAGSCLGSRILRGPPTADHWTIGNVIINNIHVTWSNISASPLGVSLSRYAGCVFFFLVMRRPPFPNWHSTYSRIY